MIKRFASIIVRFILLCSYALLLCELEDYEQGQAAETAFAFFELALFLYAIDPFTSPPERLHLRLGVGFWSKLAATEILAHAVVVPIVFFFSSLGHRGFRDWWNQRQEKATCRDEYLKDVYRGIPAY